MFVERVKNAVRHEYAVDLENLRSSLAASQSAAIILIERRLQAYEEFNAMHRDLFEADFNVASATGTAKQKAMEELDSAIGEFVEWAQLNAVFIPQEIVNKAKEITQSFHRMLEGLRTGQQGQTVGTKRLDEMIRADLALICETGKLPGTPPP